MRGVTINRQYILDLLKSHWDGEVSITPDNTIILYKNDRCALHAIINEGVFEDSVNRAIQFIAAYGDNNES